MDVDETKKIFGSGKLSLRKRRREKRKKCAKTTTKDGGCTGGKRSRAPIPSFSPLEFDEESRSSHVSAILVQDNSGSTQKPKIENAKTKKLSLNDENGPVEIPEEKEDSNTSDNSNVSSTPPRMQDAKSKHLETNFHAPSDKECIALPACDSKELLKEGEQIPQIMELDDNRTFINIINDEPMQINISDERGAKIESNGTKSHGKEHVKPVSADRMDQVIQPLVPVKLNDIHLNRKNLQQSNLKTLFSNANTCKLEGRITTPNDSKTVENTNSSSTADGIIASPTLKDFNIPRAKYLNDREIDLSRKHSILMNESKNVDDQKKRNTVTKSKSRKSSVPMGRSSKSKSKQCSLCATCSCSRNSALQSLEDSAISEHQNPLRRLARSDAEIERALIGRLARLEKSAAWFDGLCTKVNRELKRHRTKIKAKLQEDDFKDKPKFLRDVNLDDEGDFCAPALSRSFADRAKQKTFSFRKRAQPTLTQMLGNTEDMKTEQFDSVKILETVEDDEANDKVNSDEQTLELSKNPNPKESEQESTRYSAACIRGKSRSMWGASSMTEEQLQKSNCVQEFNPTGGGDVIEIVDNVDRECLLYEDEEDNFDYGLTELLNVFEATDDGNPFAAMNDILHGIKTIYNEKQPVRTRKDLQIDVDPTTLSQLSPVAKTRFNSMKLKVESDWGKVEVLDAECPSWRENMRFALRQNPNELKEALQNVKWKRKCTENAIETLQRQNTVLEVFEMALNESIERRKDEDNSALNVIQEADS